MYIDYKYTIISYISYIMYGTCVYYTQFYTSYTTPDLPPSTRAYVCTSQTYNTYRTNI